MLEIEEAEQQATKVSIDNPFPLNDASQIKLMPVASWNQYKDLFTDDFDARETDKISDFYTRCEEYDRAAELNATLTFQQNQQELRNNMQRVLAEYAKAYSDELENAAATDKERLEQEYIQRRQRFLDIYGNNSPTHMYTYVPVKPFNDAKNALQDLETSLSLTSVGIKLKQAARPKGFFKRTVDRIFHR